MFRLVILTFLVFFTIESQSAAPTTSARPVMRPSDLECRVSCNASNPDYEGLSRVMCSGNPEAVASCIRIVGQIEESYNSCFSSCMEEQSLKNVCEVTGGQWEAGSCQTTCPAGTSPFTDLYTMENSCACSNSDVHIATGSSDAEGCAQQSVETRECPELIVGVNDRDVENCENENRIAVERRQNEQEAAVNAGVEASNRLNSLIASAVAEAEAGCRAALAEVQGACDVQKLENSRSSASVNAEGSSKEACERALDTVNSQMQEVHGQRQACSSSRSGISSSCPSRTSVQTATVDTMCVGSGDTEGCISQPVSKSGSGAVPSYSSTESSARAAGASFSNVASPLTSSLAQSKEGAVKCLAELGEDIDEDNTTNQFVNHASALGGPIQKGLSSYGGGSGGYSNSELSSGAGYAAGRAIGDVAKGAYDKLRGRDSGSLSPSGGLGDNMAGISDEAVLGNGNGGQAYSPTGGASGARSGGAKTTSAGNLRGNSSSNSKVGANARKKRRSKTAKARNLAQGYKTMKATDGGSSFSIKPSSFKKYGSKVLKQKLAEARKLHGKDMPLIFRNGKFVLDFLAMKESRGFKARTSAMESYLKGGQRKSASVADLHVHQDSKLNIFKIMNFRYQRQHFESD